MILFFIIASVFGMQRDSLAFADTSRGTEKFRGIESAVKKMFATLDKAEADPSTVIKELEDLIEDLKGEIAAYKDRANAAAEQVSKQKVLLDEAQDEYVSAVAMKTAADSTYEINNPILLHDIMTVKNTIDILSNAVFNISFELVRDVPSDGKNTPSDWTPFCSEQSNVTTRTVLLIVMGENKDYFQPTGAMTFCEFLKTNNYKWSASKAGPWIVPEYHLDTCTCLGGCAPNWPTDGRKYIPFWGRTRSYPTQKGGCCHLTKKDAAAWNRPFQMYVSQ